MKIALGVFDGVHQGHFRVIEKAHRVVTFDPHPQRGVKLLTSIQERQDLIGNLDIIKFTKKVAKMTPREFVEKVILKKYKKDLEGIIVGHDFNFGCNRTGSVKTLRELGQEFGFQVEEIAEVYIDGVDVRSSNIRNFLNSGAIEKANKFLGRDYQLSGRVGHGAGRGHKLGFPTVNIKPQCLQKLIPAAGVYAGEIIADNKLFPAAIFVGTSKTFYDERPVIEAHILNFKKNIYGSTVTLFFQKYLRPVIKFEHVTELVEQITADLKSVAGNKNRVVFH